MNKNDRMYSSSSVFIIYLNKWLLESLFDLLFFKISDHQIFCQTYIPFRINRDSSLSSLRLAQSIKIMAWDNYTFLTDWQSNEYSRSLGWVTSWTSGDSWNESIIYPLIYEDSWWTYFQYLWWSSTSKWCVLRRRGWRRPRSST